VPVKTERICQLVAAAIGARCAFAARNGPAGADGVAYLEVAHAYLRHDWHTALNGYWGPLYSWLLALGMRVSPPQYSTELLLARTVNFIIFLVAVYTFGAAWRALGRRSQHASEPSASVPVLYPIGWTVFGYALFVTSSAWCVGVLTPDLCVAAIVFATIAVLLRLEDGRKHSIASYVAWGALLGLGYYAKVILFYFALFLLLAVAIRHLRIRSYARPALAVVTFMIATMPFIFFLSRSLGRFTIGETGRLNYAWFACGPETKTWMTGQAYAAPMPFYPGPLLHNNPMVFQVPHISAVAYAPWYDASRFDPRSRILFSLRSQLNRILRNLRPLSVILQSEEALLLALAILVLFSPHKFLHRFAESWFYTIPILAIIGMYMMVSVTSRFLLAFSPLLWGTALAAVAVPTHLRDTVRPIVLAGIVVFALHAGPGFLHFVWTEDHSARADIVIAQSLPSYGISRGDSVAVVGEGQDAMWAQLANVTIVAEIWPTASASFWSSSSSEQQEMVRDMANAGAKAIVWRRDSGQSCPLPWHSLADSSGCILLSIIDSGS
jgi:hypothetical protein